jgi:hypothetical protein
VAAARIRDAYNRTRFVSLIMEANELLASACWCVLLSAISAAGVGLERRRIAEDDLKQLSE